MLGISEHDRRPKEVIERERKNKFDEEQQARLHLIKHKKCRILCDVDWK